MRQCGFGQRIDLQLAGQRSDSSILQLEVSKSQPGGLQRVPVGTDI